MPQTEGLREMQEQAVTQLEWLTGEAGLSQQEVARRLDVPQPAISRWINRHVRPTRRSCRDIGQLYEIVRAEQKAAPAC